MIGHEKRPYKKNIEPSSRLCRHFLHLSFFLFCVKVKNKKKKKMQAKKFKVVLIGPSNTGKSSFVRDLTQEYQAYPTLGVKVVPYDIDSQYRLSIWDCAGDARYEGLGPGYIKRSDLVLVFEDEAYVEWIPSNVPYHVTNKKNYAELLQMIVNTLITRPRL